jgi:DNA-binding NarL/FixJ family response regulator
LHARPYKHHENNPLMAHPTILVVEDFDKFRQFIVSTLHEKTEYLVTQSSDGLEAIQKAEEQKPDLVLLDIGLPTLNGISVAKLLRRLTFPPKIVFVSQESSPEIVREALDLGALGYVHKPRARTDLLPAVDLVLAGKRFVSSGLKFSESTEAQAPHSHEILFYSDESVLLDGLTRFVGSALTAGNAAMVWVIESHREKIIQQLRARGVDIDGAIQRGLYVSSDGGEADPVRFLETIRSLSDAAFKAGKKRPRVALCGDFASRLWTEGRLDEAIRVEQQSSVLARTHDIDILCAYPLDDDQSNEAFKSIRAEHGAVFTG